MKFILAAVFAALTSVSPTSSATQPSGALSTMDHCYILLILPCLDCPEENSFYCRTKANGYLVDCDAVEPPPQACTLPGGAPGKCDSVTGQAGCYHF